MSGRHHLRLDLSEATLRRGHDLNLAWLRRGCPLTLSLDTLLNGHVLNLALPWLHWEGTYLTTGIDHEPLWLANSVLDPTLLMNQLLLHQSRHNLRILAYWS